MDELLNHTAHIIYEQFRFSNVGLRTKMDVLLIEETNLEFKSKNIGVMYDCSHKGIVTTALGVEIYSYIRHEIYLY